MQELTLDFRLTDKGLKHVQRVTQVVFAYIRFLEKTVTEGTKVWLFEEIKQMSQVSYEYFKVPDPWDSCQAMADELNFTLLP